MGLASNRIKKKAVDLIRAAADQGDFRAQYNLGKIYRDAQGVEQSDTVSAQWFETAAEQGYAKAQNHLGVRYARGQGVVKDDVQALKWILLAAEQGHSEAIANRQALILRMKSDDVDRARNLASHAARKIWVKTGAPAIEGQTSSSDSNGSLVKATNPATSALPPAPPSSPPAPPPQTVEPTLAPVSPPSPPPEVVEPAPAPEATEPIPAPAETSAPPSEIAEPDTTSAAAAAAPVPESEQLAAVSQTGRFWVQLGSFRDPARSEALWDILKQAHPAVLGGIAHNVVRADLKKKKGVFYRLRAGPFADQAAAQELCKALRAAGRDCFVPSP